MNDIFRKLNLKDETRVLVLNAPESFEPHLKGLEGVEIHRALADLPEVEFSIAFVTRQAALDKIAGSLVKKAKGDAKIWFAYPKKSSKRYECEFDRDSGWEVMGKAGYEPVRMVAIDEDWSALRFRHVGFIRTMKRDEKRAMTTEGKARTSKSR